MPRVVDCMPVAGLSAAGLQGLLNTINSAVVATGSTQANTTAISAGLNVVTGADGTKGVVLPAGTPGDNITVWNSSASALQVFPPIGSNIGTGAANAVFAQTANKACTYHYASPTLIVPVLSA